MYFNISGLSYPLLAAAHDEEGLDAVLQQVGVPLAPRPVLHVVVPVQVVQGGLGDVDAPGRTETR